MPYKDPKTNREYQKKWRAQRRQQYFEGKCCAYCGSTENLELDHIDPSTKESHAIWTWSKERREAELAKCQPLCHDCHFQKSLKERTKPETHGHVTEYRKGCRCTDCRKANALKQQRLRAKKK